jgi:hypothetical protein
MMTKGRRPPLVPPRGDRRLKGRALEQGSTAPQRSTPPQGFDFYVAGFHCARHDPRM